MVAPGRPVRSFYTRHEALLHFVILLVVVVALLADVFLR
jgi:hypothetical protein